MRVHGGGTGGLDFIVPHLEPMRRHKAQSRGPPDITCQATLSVVAAAGSAQQRLRGIQLRAWEKASCKPTWETRAEWEALAGPLALAPHPMREAARRGRRSSQRGWAHSRRRRQGRRAVRH